MNGNIQPSHRNRVRCLLGIQKYFSGVSSIAEVELDISPRDDIPCCWNSPPGIFATYGRYSVWPVLVGECPPIDICLGQP